MAFGDHVQSAQGTGASGNASATFPGATTAGNLLLFGVGRSVTHSAGGAWGTPSEFTLIEDSGINVGNVAGAWWWKIAEGDEGIVTVAGTNEQGNWRAVVIELEGPFHASTPFDVSEEDVGSLATVVTSLASGTTAITSQAEALAVAFWAFDQAANITDGRAYSNSFTEVIFADAAASIARAGITVARRVLAATGTFSSTFSTTDTGDEGYGSIAVFRAAVSGSAPAVALNTADDTEFSTGQPTLEFTGTDADGDSIRYQIQISDNPSFAEGTNSTDSLTGGSGGDIHPNPTGGLTWLGTRQVDDRPGQSFTADGGILDTIRINMTRDEVDTDGTAHVRVYAHAGVFGTSSTPLNPADPEDTPTPNWLAVSDGIPLDGTMSASALWYDFEFSGVNRIRLEAGVHYMFTVDWLPNDTTSSNTIEIHADTGLGHDGNAWIDGDSPNYGVRGDFDVRFELLEVQLLIDALSGTDDEFINTVNGGDTDPFTSGQKIAFTVQVADELDEGVYYWRVRGSDPDGTGGFGDWSETRSFAVTGDDPPSPPTPSVPPGILLVIGGSIQPVYITNNPKRIESNIAIPVQGVTVVDRPVLGGAAIPVYIVSQSQIDAGEYELLGGNATPVADINVIGITRAIEGGPAIPVFIAGGSLE